MLRIFSSLRFRLLLIVLLALLPAFGLALYNFAQQRQVVVSQAQEDALNLAKNLANHQKELVEGARQMLFVLEQLPVMRGDDNQACQDYLVKLKENNPRYMNIIKWDTEGNMLCDAAQSPKPHKSPYMDHIYKVLETNDFTIVGFVMSPHTGERALSLGYPIWDENGKAQAILFAPVQINSFNQLLTQASLPEGSTITLRDGSGTILARYPFPGNWVGFLDPDIEASPALANFHGEGTLTAHGADKQLRLYAYTPVYSLTPAELYLVVGIPYHVAMGKVEQDLGRSLLILGVAGLTALLAIWLGGEIFFLHPIQNLLEVTRRMTAGDLTARTQETREASELSELSQSFDLMAEALEKRENEYLQAQADILSKERERTRLLHQLITANDDERTRIAQEIHDGLAQTVGVMQIWSNEAQDCLDEHQIEGVQKALEKIGGAARDANATLREEMLSLRGSLIPNDKLTTLLEKYLNRFQSQWGIQTELQVDLCAKDESETPVCPEAEVQLLRIFQECITNIRRHANASWVKVHLACEDGWVNLRIVDNGIGFDLQSVSAERLGLRIMRERAASAGGELEISSQIGQGTQLEVRFPHRILQEQEKG